MEERLSREEILSRLQTEHDRFIATVSRLTPAQLLEPTAVGFWSVKDVLSHLIFWNVYPVEEIEGAVNGETFQQPHETTDEINARVVAQHRSSTLDAVREDFEVTYENICDTVRHLPDEAFKAGSRIEQVLGETIHGTLANNTYEHWPIHEAQIRQWIERGMTG